MPGWVTPPSGLSGLWYGLTTGIGTAGLAIPEYINTWLSTPSLLTNVSNIIFYGVIGIVGLIILIIVFSLRK